MLPSAEVSEVSQIQDSSVSKGLTGLKMLSSQRTHFQLLEGRIVSCPFQILSEGDLWDVV